MLLARDACHSAVHLGQIQSPVGDWGLLDHVGELLSEFSLWKSALPQGATGPPLSETADIESKGALEESTAERAIRSLSRAG